MSAEAFSSDLSRWDISSVTVMTVRIYAPQTKHVDICCYCDHDLTTTPSPSASSTEYVCRQQFIECVPKGSHPCKLLITTAVPLEVLVGRSYLLPQPATTVSAATYV